MRSDKRTFIYVENGAGQSQKSRKVSHATVLGADQGDAAAWKPERVMSRVARCDEAVGVTQPPMFVTVL